MFLKVSQTSQANTLFNKVAGLKAWWRLSCKTFKSIFFCVTPPMKAFVEQFEAPHRSEKIKFNFSHAWLSRWTHYSAVTPCFSLFFAFIFTSSFCCTNIYANRKKLASCWFKILLPDHLLNYLVSSDHSTWIKINLISSNTQVAVL